MTYDIHVLSLRPHHVYIQILINGNKYSIIDNQPLTSLRTLYTSRDWPLIVEWHTLLRLLFAPLRRRAAKLTSSHVSILTCEKWYWDRELTSSDWKYRKTEYRGKQFFLHWIYNKIIRDFKMTSKQPEYRTMRLRSFEFQLYKYLLATKICNF